MEECEAVGKELEKVLSKFESLQKYAGTELTNAEQHIRQLQQEIAAMPADSKLTDLQINIIKDSIQKTKAQLSKITTDHREMHSSVSKVGKAIDRNFLTDFTETASMSDVLNEERNNLILNKLIASHYHRQGMQDVAQKLLEESKTQLDLPQETPFAEIYSIYDRINQQDLEPALKWATEHSREIEMKNSGLEFKLHRLAFLQILNGGTNTQAEAIAYARKYLSKFVHRFEKEIQILMGTLLYLPCGIDKSPYKHLAGREMWLEAADTFLRDACAVKGIDKDSQLGVTVNSGCTALPALLSLNMVMASRHVFGIWGNRDELPIEIDLDPEHRYHSIFACPILRQQSTDDNPPMRLSCGHVISRDALHKLSGSIRLSASRPRLKCPYCPMEQSPHDAKLVYF